MTAPSSTTLDHPQIDCLQHIIRPSGQTGLAITAWIGDAAVEERALVNHVEPVAQVRQRLHREAGQRQPASTRAAQLALAGPPCLATLRSECLVFDVLRRKLAAWRDAERLDPHAPPDIPDPAPGGEAAVTLPLDMQRDPQFGVAWVRRRCR